MRADRRRSGIILGRSVGGVYPVRSCGRNPPPALPREQSRGGVDSDRQAHRKVPPAGERKGPAEQNRHGPSTGGSTGRGRAGWRVGTAPSGGLKTTRRAGWLQRLLRRLGAFPGVGTRGPSVQAAGPVPGGAGRSGPSSGAAVGAVGAVGAGAVRMLRARHVRRERR